MRSNYPGWNAAADVRMNAYREWMTIHTIIAMVGQTHGATLRDRDFWHAECCKAGFSPVWAMLWADLVRLMVRLWRGAGDGR